MRSASERAAEVRCDAGGGLAKPMLVVKIKVLWDSSAKTRGVPHDKLRNGFWKKEPNPD